jgi:threonyl-tRNA synthetase
VHIFCLFIPRTPPPRPPHPPHPLPRYEAYGRTVQQRLWSAGIYCDLDETNKTIARKVLQGQLDGYNFILVVGANEEIAGTVNVRVRDEAPGAERHEVMTKIDECIAMMQQLKATFQ